MKVEFDNEEAWNLLSYVVNRVLEEVDLTDADKAKVRRWKSDEMRVTSQEMQVLTQKVNEDLQQTMARKSRNQLRRPDWASPVG